MRLSPIKVLLLAVVISGLLTVFSPYAQANIPVKSVCVKNDKDQPLLFNGQGIWVKHNNASGAIWFKQSDTSGCAQFSADKNFMKEFFKTDNNVDMDYDGNPDGPTNINPGDLGCASGPFGFEVVVPKEWSKDWTCESVGTTEGPFPCCRGPEDSKYVKNCTACQTKTLGYPGQQTSKQCYCDRSAHNGAQDSECPICFHNDGVQINVVLHCKKTKVTELKSIDKPEPTQFATKPTQALSCLDEELCSDTDPLRKCQPNTSSASGTRRVRLINVKQRKQVLLPSQPSKPFWITECVMEGAKQENASYICTTGSSATDVTALGVDNFSKLKTAYGYSSTMYAQDGTKVTQPVLTTEALLDTYEWETTTSKVTSSVFMGIYDGDATGAATVGSGSGQQQATLSFQDSCNLVQDPFGHVFDSHSLEPLANASVEISQQNKSGAFQKLNSQKTGKDGRYSFYVNDGTYKILAAKPNYMFPGTAALLNPNAARFYSNLYHGEDIVQKGEAQLLDIPLDPVDIKQSEAYAKTNPIEILNYFQTIHKTEKNYIIEGQVTHPRALVVAYASVPDKKNAGKFIRGRSLNRTEADNSGYFKVVIPLSSIGENEMVGELEAVKRTTLAKDTVMLNPLFDSVKGFAYDTQGKLIPGAIVEVMTPVSNKPYYVARADAKGFFMIDSNHLPPVQMSLKFVSLNNTADTVSTRSFLAQNNGATFKDGGNQTIAMAGDINGDVLGVSSSAEEPDRPPLSTRVIFLGALVLAVLVGAVYKVYIRK